MRRPAAAGALQLTEPATARVFRKGLGIFEIEQLLGDGHLELVDLAEIGESTVGLAVKDHIAVEMDLEAATVRWGHLDGDIARRVGLEKLRRQPRGDREVASSYTVNDFSFDLSVFRDCHIFTLAWILRVHSVGLWGRRQIDCVLDVGVGGPDEGRHLRLRFAITVVKAIDMQQKRSGTIFALEG